MANPWQPGNRIEVRATGDGATCRWQFELGAASDLRLVIDEQTPLGARAGELIVVGGAALLSRGLELPAGHELDAVDGPGLMLALVVELLGRARPDGPAAIIAPVALDHHEATAPLTMSTLGATASFPAPWQVRGELHPAADGAIAFDLVFSHAADDGGPTTIALAGTWAQTSPAPALDDAMALAGWRVHGLGARTTDALLDYGTTAAPAPSATLGQLRASLRPHA